MKLFTLTGIFIRFSQAMHNIKKAGPSAIAFDIFRFRSCAGLAFFLILAAAFILFAKGACASEEIVLLAMEDKEDYPQWLGNTSEINAVRPGIAVEFFRMVGEKTRTEIKFARYPWKRCIEIELKNGKVDGVIRTRYLKRREAFGVYPMKNGVVDRERRYMTRNFNFYAKKSSHIGINGGKLREVPGKIGFTYGYAVEEDLKNMGVEAEPGLNVEENIKNLSHGNLIAVVALDSAGDHVIEKYPEIEKIPSPFITIDLYLILSHQFYKKRPDLSERIWDAVRSLRESELPKLIEKYKE